MEKSIGTTIKASNVLGRLFMSFWRFSMWAFAVGSRSGLCAGESSASTLICGRWDVNNKYINMVIVVTQMDKIHKYFILGQNVFECVNIPRN